MDQLAIYTPTAGALITSEAARKTLVEEFCDYVRATSPSASAATVTTYKRGALYVGTYLASIGKSFLDADRADIRAYRTALEARHMSPSSIRLYLSAARRVFEWIAETDRGEDITAGLKVRIRKEDRHVRKQLPENTAAPMLALIDRSTVQGKRDFAIIRLMLTCGLRCCEVCRANVEGLDTNANGGAVLRVRRKGKTAERELPISRSALQAIREYLDARGGEVIPETITIGDKTRTETPLFSALGNRNGGGRMSTRAVSGMVKSRMRAAGIDDPLITAHSLRHTAISAKARIVRETGNGTLADVQAFAGHSDPKTTMIYNHELDELMDTSAEDIDARLFGL